MATSISIEEQQVLQQPQVLQQQQVLQIVSFTILNDSTIESRFSQEGRRWRKAMRTIREQTGWLRTLWGRDMNSPHKVDVFIVWVDIEAAESFQNSPSFEVVFHGINISPLTAHTITTHTKLSSHGFLEMVTLFFPTTLTIEKQEFFETQLQHYTARLPHDEIKSIVHGWTVGPVGHGEGTARGCLVFLEWGSLDRMWEVKRNEESAFNNCFVPLREEAESGARTALYEKLNEVKRERWCCVIM